MIDQAHHKNYARLALGEAAEFDRAIELAINMTGPDTLIIVTADHSHAFTMNGYAPRGNDILGEKAFGYIHYESVGFIRKYYVLGFGNQTKTDPPYLTLSYGNGPGFDYQYAPNSLISKFPWKNAMEDEENRFRDPWYQHVGSFYLEDETHGGEDVAMYAKGPGSHLIRGVIEQNYAAHVISYAACIGPHASLNQDCPRLRSAATTTSGTNSIFVWIAVLVSCIYGFHRSRVS